MGIPFEQTVQGHQYYNRQLPQLIKGIEDLNKNIEAMNKNIELLTTLLNKSDAVEEMQTIKSDGKALNDKDVKKIIDELPF